MVDSQRFVAIVPDDLELDVTMGGDFGDMGEHMTENEHLHKDQEVVVSRGWGRTAEGHSVGKILTAQRATRAQARLDAPPAKKNVRGRAKVSDLVVEVEDEGEAG